MIRGYSDILQPCFRSIKTPFPLSAITNYLIMSSYLRTILIPFDPLRWSPDIWTVPHACVLIHLHSINKLTTNIYNLNYITDANIIIYITIICKFYFTKWLPTLDLIIKSNIKIWKHSTKDKHYILVSRVANINYKPCLIFKCNSLFYKI